MNCLGQYPPEKLTINSTCIQFLSANRYFTATHNCKIILEANEVELPVDDSKERFFGMHSREKDASCRAVKVFASADSTVPAQHNLTFGPDTAFSSIEAIFVGDEYFILSGSNPTIATIELIQSIYRNENNTVATVSKGHLVNRITFDAGSYANNKELHKSFGVGVKVQQKLDKTVALIRHTMKVTYAMLLTLLGGTFVYLGYFGNVLPVFQTLMNINCPCRRKVQKELTTIFRDSLKKSQKTASNKEFIEEIKAMMEEHLTTGID